MVLIQPWATTELTGYAYFSAKGYRILAPLVKNNGYDFVAEKDGDFIRVNVKTAYLNDKNRPNSWSISLPGSKGCKVNRVNEVDLFLVWVPYQERFIELPGDFFKGSVSKSQLIPKTLLKEENDKFSSFFRG
jgi:hypothetical protein